MFHIIYINSTITYSIYRYRPKIPTNIYIGIGPGIYCANVAGFTH